MQVISTSLRAISCGKFTSQLRAMSSFPMIKLNNGYEMPGIGLGTYSAKSEIGVKAVMDAIDVGYRHFDTAFSYKNEEDVGLGIANKIKSGDVKREDLFITTKLANIFHEPERVAEVCQQQMKSLGLDYIDLYLMHFPIGFVYHNDDMLWPMRDDGKQDTNDVDYIDTWKAMEELVKNGWVRSIGISNFNSEQIDRLLKSAEVKPVTNQVECNPLINQRNLIQFCKERDIVITGYSPVARLNLEEKKPAFMFDPKLIEIAEKHKKTTAQITLRYLVQLGVIPIPKSVTKSRIQQNFEVFDFELNDTEMKVLDSFNTNERLVHLPHCKHHKYWPYGLPY